MKTIFIITLISITLPSCAAIQSTRIQAEGNKITKEQIEEIKPAVTTKESVISAFGDPTKTEIKPDGTEMLIYAYTEKTTPTYLGGFIVNERQTKISVTTLEITIKDGLVISYNYKKEEEK